MRTQIHGIAFRDPTMDRTHGSFDYRANAMEFGRAIIQI